MENNNNLKDTQTQRNIREMLVHNLANHSSTKISIIKDFVNTLKVSEFNLHYQILEIRLCDFTCNLYN
jgi:iron only hydrogenase large subunit-like protein